MKLLFILTLVFTSIWSECQVLALQTTIYTTITNEGSKLWNSSNVVKSSLGNPNDGAYEICRKTFPESKLDPASSFFIYDGCTVACLIGANEWHKVPNQIGKPCPFNMRGTCSTEGLCQNEGPVELGQLDIKIVKADLTQMQDDNKFYDWFFVMATIRNSSEPWPLASMDYTASAAYCASNTVSRGSLLQWGYTSHSQ